MVGASSVFPPCTSEQCNVPEAEKKAVDSSKPPCELAERCVSACAAYGKVCPCTARIAAHAACDAISELKKDSKLFQDKPFHNVALNTDDLVMGEKLGSGAFCNVNKCVELSGPEAGKDFAIKYLKRKAMVDLHKFKHGAADLAVEAHFLSVLSHPHIIKLHGVTAGSVETNVASGKECGFFLLIDLLQETLEQRIDRWAEEQEKHNGNLLTRFTSDFRERKRQELVERIRVAYAIADAMEYLHSKDIIFRDLKPDNIGFDKDGVLKIFDFGLAKELKPGKQNEHGKYKLTGNTGSRRYMAPEVAMDEPYDKSVDVFSFGILLWELCSAEKPYYGYSSGKHMHLVVLGGERPKMDSHHTLHWPMNLQWLMNRCWATRPEDRPAFTLIKHVLRDILASRETLPEFAQSVKADHQQHNTHAEAVDCGSPGKQRWSLFRTHQRRPSVEASPVGPPPNGFKSMAKPNQSSRSKSWGFNSMLR